MRRARAQGRARIGVPYARDCAQCWKASICPACGAHIENKQRKDFESFSKVEYAQHWVAEHEGTVEIGSERRPDGNGYRSIVVNVERADGVGERVGLIFNRAPDGCPLVAHR